MTPKARVWLEDYKELLPVCLIDFVNNEFCVLPYAELEGGGQITVKGLDKLEWFTGLQDNCHKDIYEGDIVLTNGDVGDCTVVYRDGAFCLGLTLVEGETFGDFVTIRDAMGQAKKVKKTIDMKVIGNIHQEEVNK